MMRTLTLSISLSLLLALAGCGGDEEGDSSGSRTSGGDDDGASGSGSSGSGSSGSGSSGSGGSRGNGSGNADDGWDGDDDGTGSSSSTGSQSGSGSQTGTGTGSQSGQTGTGQTGQTGTGTQTPAQPAVNPWGQTRAEQCARPARPDMNSAARSAFQNGMNAAQRGDNQGAQQGFVRALGEDSRAYRAAYNLGVLADRAGNEAQALDYYRQALRILPDFELAAEGIVNIQLRRNQVNEAVALVAPIAQQYRSNLAIQALHARVLGEANQFDASWAAARRALECDERYVPALLALVRTSLKQNRRELAESILTQAITTDAQNAEAQFIRGTLYRDQPGRQREALEAFQRASRSVCSSSRAAITPRRSTSSRTRCASRRRSWRCT
jgi:Tfp pilus assembly protein PilF